MKKRIAKGLGWLAQKLDPKVFYTKAEIELGKGFRFHGFTFVCINYKMHQNPDDTVQATIEAVTYGGKELGR